MNLPNKLTVGRLILTVIFVAVTASPHGWGSGWAYTAGLLIFSIASATDYLDGYLARKYKLITAFGKLMDPLADKVLMCAAFVMLSATPRPGVDHVLLPGWVTVTVLAREFLVTGLRLVASAQGHIMSADRLGKHKTAWQIATACYFLVFLAASEPLLSWVHPMFEWPGFGPRALGSVMIVMTLLTTIISGWRYLWNNRSLMLNEM